MDRFLVIWSVNAYVESHIRARIEPKDLAKAMGFSLPHLREVYAETTGIPLARYILTRKVCNAAHELLHTKKSVSALAEEYGFACHDTFTRAFKRVAGMTPSECRRARPRIERVKLCAGVYGVGLPEAAHMKG